MQYVNDKKDILSLNYTLVMLVNMYFSGTKIAAMYTLNLMKLTLKYFDLDLSIIGKMQILIYLAFNNYQKDSYVSPV